MFINCWIFLEAMLIGVVGKANVGKSTFFKAATLAPAEIGPYPFVTIKPNRAVAYVKTKCPCSELKIKCDPKNAPCMNGWRFVPFELLDVAGLIPGAHEGKGLGNQFLDDLRQADCLLHVLDAAGQTDEKGVIIKPGIRDPALDVKFLEEEFDYWLTAIIERHSNQKRSQPFDIKDLEVALSGLKITKEQIANAERVSGLQVKTIRGWKTAEFFKFSSSLRQQSKPIIIGANKVDLATAKENIERLKKEFPKDIFVPVCAEAELALREASEKGMIEYVPGESDFREIKIPEEKQKKALQFIKEKILKPWGTTGVQQCLNTAVFEKLRYIVVYPVQDENKLTGDNNRVLPDAFLLPEGSNPLDLAAKVHTDLAKNFIGAIDCRTKRKISRETKLKHGDIIKILVRK